ncbi:MAG: hypothetical protein H7A36_01435 [Chlamydiales bacterium]|nr:hypothetical protein [Chlamydiales bacterium]
MLRCCALHTAPPDPRQAEQFEKSCKVSAIALAVISVAFLTVGAALLGVGMSKKMMGMGIGLIPYLGGWFFLLIGTGTLVWSGLSASAAFCSNRIK